MWHRRFAGTEALHSEQVEDWLIDRKRFSLDRPAIIRRATGNASLLPSSKRFGQLTWAPCLGPGVNEALQSGKAEKRNALSRAMGTKYFALGRWIFPRPGDQIFSNRGGSASVYPVSGNEALPSLPAAGNNARPKKKSDRSRSPVGRKRPSRSAVPGPRRPHRRPGRRRARTRSGPAAGRGRCRGRFHRAPPC